MPQTSAKAKAARLRAQAAYMRRAAAHPTQGGHEENRFLSDLAAKLEAQADELDPQDE